ncbi:MAG: ROK family protein [Clostridia bacterium]|nr:ROK family protein [Clostridia bacterium]MBR5717458.1 ROK family protein [Clostridia bacterium]
MLRMGFDIGGTTIKGGLVDDDLKLVSRVDRPTPFGDAGLLCDSICAMADELTRGTDPCRIAGVTVPGSVSRGGEIIDAWNIGLRNIPIRRMLEEKLDAETVIVKNDADAACCAELKIGALQGVKTGLMLTLGTGVGGSIIIDGKLFHGGLDRGTELGHAMINRGGAVCGCGHRGCIETLCSASALKRLAQKACQERKGMIYSLSERGEAPDAKLLIDCARKGDSMAVQLFDEYTDVLSDAIASFVNILDPQVIVIGGGVSGAGDFLTERLKAKVPPRTFFGSCGSIVAAQAGNDAGIIGAVME